MPSTFILVGSRYRRSWSSFLVNLAIGLSILKKPDPLKIRPYQPSIVYPGMLSAPSFKDLLSSYSAVRSKSLTEPIPSHREHMPPRRLKLAFSVLVLPSPRSTVMAPLAFTVGTVNEDAFGAPIVGCPGRPQR